MPERTSSCKEIGAIQNRTGQQSWPTRLRKLAWLPIPILVLAMVVFWVLDLRTAYEFPHLLMAVEFLTRTVASLFILYLAGRSFLVRGAPGLLLLGCGVAAWGTSGFVATSTLTTRDVNLGVTISNLGILLAALCHLSGVVLSLGSKRTIRAAGLWLGAGYALALGAVGLITLLTFAHRLPIFFVEGQGGLSVRHLVLASALAMFALTAVLLWEGNRPSLSPFTWWYTLALLLIAAGIFGMLLQSSRNSLLNWTCRTTQYLGGIYMLIAALAARRDSGLRITTAPVTNEARYGYGVAIVLVVTAAALRLAFLQALGTRVSFATFFPAVMLAALYGGLRAGLLATLLSAVVADYFWIGPLGFAIVDWGDWLGITVFLVSGTMISGITEAMRRAQTRATTAEAEAKVAAERTAAAEALQAAHSRINSMLEQMGDSFAAFDRDWRYTHLNLAAAQAFHKTPEQLLGKTLWEMWPAAYDLPVGVHFRRSLQENIPLQFETFYPEPLNRWFECRCYPMPEGLATFFTDITERKRAEEALAAAHQQVQSIIDNATSIIYAFDLEERFVMANKTLAKLLNTTPEQMIGKRRHEFMPQEDADWHEANDRQVIETGRALEFEEHSELNGRSITWLTTKFPLRDAQGKTYAVAGISADVSEHKRAEEALRASEARQRLTFQASSTGTFEVNLLTGESIWNRVEFELLGLTPGDVQPPPGTFFRFVHPDDLAALSAQWSEATRTGHFEAEFRIVRTDGQERWLAGRGQFIRENKAGTHDPDASGEAVRFLGVNYDITERKQMEIALKEADRRKDEFLAMLAHELRNPLAPVRYAIQILRMAELPEEARQRQQGIIDRQVTHMGRLLDDLLDVSRVTRGKVELRRQPLYLADVLAHAADTARPMYEAKRQRLHFAPPPADLRVEADIDRLTQVVGNLLFNASKFTGEGGQIWLEAPCKEEQAVICVRDTGLGITPELLPRIFDLFVQADDPRHRSQGGLGIGLTLVKRLVEMHGGTVEARSDGECQGSEFIIRLPALPRETPEEQASQTLAPEAVGQRCRRILVVDDIADSAASLAELLTLWGHEARSVHDGSAAIETVRAWQPEVVLMDIGMPGMDGYETARRLRAEHGRSGLPLVALTGFGQETDREAAHAAGFDAHLVKPVDIAALRDLLARIAD